MKFHIVTIDKKSKYLFYFLTLKFNLSYLIFLIT